LRIVEALAVFALLFASGFLVNSMTDVDVDSRYKTSISDAVGVLGKKALATLIVLHVVVALLLTIDLCHFYRTYWLLLWVSVATFFGITYSIQPFHFKVRGVLQFSLIVFSVIMVSMVYYVVGGVPPLPVLIVFLGFISVHHGIDLVNQAHDYPEDRASGLSTPAVRWGIRPTLIASLVITLIGVSSGLVGFYFVFRELPDLVIFGSTVGFRVLFAVAALVLFVAYSVPVIGTWKIVRGSHEMATEEDRASLIKRQVNYPMWQLTGVLGVTLIGTFFFMWRIA
jgi:4-hydroxybenzoate polyprenyltransferase